MEASELGIGNVDRQRGLWAKRAPRVRRGPASSGGSFADLRVDPSLL